MKLISIEEFQHLVEKPDGVSVSIYMPTEISGKETQQNAIRLKNLMRRADQAITGQDLMRAREATALLRPVQELVDDVPFWQHQREGLAVFVSPDLFRRYRVPIRFRELVEVKNHFHLKPLLRLLSCDGEFGILSLNRKSVRLFRSTRFRIDEIDLGDTPTSVIDVMGTAPGERGLQWRSAASSGRGDHSALFHGHGRGDEDLTPELRKLLTAVDRSVCARLRAQSVPLMLVGSEDLLSIYRELSDYPDLYSEGLKLNASEMRDDELRERTWSIIGPFFQREQERVAERFRQLSGTGMASSNLDEIVPASHDGRVEALFVARGSYRWGQYDSDTRAVELKGQPGNGAQDLLDLTAVQTLLHQGKVFVVESENVPNDGAPVAAVYRY
jgi:hypothetical protein